MSSWRNAVKDKVHRERSQPLARQKLGLLEKHVDYKLRAKRNHLKTDMMRNLQLKAALKNPDEFHTKMISLANKGSDTKKQQEAKRLAKIQDSRFLNAKKVEKEKKVEKLVASLQFMDNEEENNHIVFVDGEKEMNNWNAATYFDTLPEFVSRKYNRLSEKQLKEQSFAGSLNEEGDLQKMKKRREDRYKDLAENLEDADVVDRVLSHIEVQKNLTGKGRRVKIADAEDGKPAVYRWYPMRKK